MKRSGLVVLVVMLVGTATYLLSNWIQNNAANENLRSVESSFRPPAEWALIDESRYPASISCFGIDNPCPSVSLVYEVSGLTPATMVSFAPSAGLTVTGDCRPRGSVTGESTLCTATGVQAGFTIVVSAVELSGGSFRVTASITP